MEEKELKEWAASIWKEGCLLGDLAREDELSEDEVNMLVCAREGYLEGKGGIMNN